MAQITVTIPDNQVDRVREAFKAMVQEGEAVDIKNPTNQELMIVLQKYLINAVKKRVLDYEKYIYDSGFAPADIGLE